MTHKLQKNKPCARLCMKTCAKYGFSIPDASGQVVPGVDNKNIGYKMFELRKLKKMVFRLLCKSFKSIEQLFLVNLPLTRKTNLRYANKSISYFHLCNFTYVVEKKVNIFIQNNLNVESDKNS